MDKGLEIAIEHQGVLTVNRKIVNLPDITPQILHDYIETGHEIIDAQLDEIEQVRRHLYRRNNVAPSILLGRLAIAGKESDVFTEKGLRKRSEELNILDLERPFRGFWVTIESADYIPEVHKNIGLYNSKFGGTWLGLRKH
jgi:hypothetical protein